MFAEREQLWAIILFVVPSDSSTDAVDTTKNLFQSDVEKALMADPQWGGLAMDSIVLDFNQFEAENGEFEGVVVIYRVHYRTLENNPYSQGA